MALPDAKAIKLKNTEKIKDYMVIDFPDSSARKESMCNEGDLDSIPELGRFPGEGYGYPFQYSGLGNSIDCTVHGVTVRHD